MVTQNTTEEEVLWMADCYSLAKRFPDPYLWLALLEPSMQESEQDLNQNINPFQYWLWMEIWKAAR